MSVRVPNIKKDRWDLIGNPNVKRLDILPKITGKAVYAYDINPKHVGERMFLYMGYIRSPYPHARIVNIDTSKAEAAGYVTLTGRELPRYALVGRGRPHTPLPIDRVRYVGEAIVAVAAPTTDGVEDAIDLIDVELEPLPYVLDAEEALKPDAPRLYDDGNKVGESEVRYGDIESGFRQSDAIIEAKIETQPEQHYEMEPRALIAYWRGGKLWIHYSGQWSHIAQILVARYFRMPLSDVVLMTSLGGDQGHVLGMALGNKAAPLEDMVVAALLAKKAGAPIKYGPTRLDNALAPFQRFPIRGYIKFGGTRDGRFLAMQATLYVNTGAYGWHRGEDAASDFYNAYTTPNVYLKWISANTNIFGSSGYMRDVGESQGHYILEVGVDMLAEELGIDPLEFRLKNMRTKENAVDPVTGYKYSGFGQPEATLGAMEKFKWKEKWKGWGVPVSVNGTKRKGVGVAILNAAKGYVSPPITGQIEVKPDGTVTFFTGLTDHGAGSYTSHHIMVAEALGLTSVDNIRVISSDTRLTTNTGVHAGSRGARVASLAIVAAVEDLKRQWFPIIAKKLGVRPESLEFGNNRIFVKDNPSIGMSFKEAAALLDKPIKGWGKFTPPPKTAYRVGGIKLVEVEVDVETAEVHFTEYVSGMDIGRVIFWKGAENQVRGGFYGMGIGEALFQEIINDPITGSFLNPNFHDFRIPTMMEVPDKVDMYWEEYHDPISGFGNKGIGENVLTGVSAAIANALSNALGGYRFTKLPITKEEIVKAIEWMRREGKL